MTGRAMVAIGAALGAIAVALGAFGAHGLRARLGVEQLGVYETAVRYHFYHALALVLVGLLTLQREAAGAASAGTAAAAWCFVAGIAIFSGSLYLLTLTGQAWLGAVTPIGGLAFIVGWILFARAGLAR
ncbi:MAG TPA: DUF423 domain-containing protein [Candidatus Binatia bacterium]|nr:DUF423 domain-containing protein [Candidatus Binatia bacterium]